MKFRPKLNRRTLKHLLQCIGLIGLMFFLIKNGFISLDATQTAILEWQWTLPSLMVLMIASILGGLRWQWLLKAQDIHLPRLKVLELTWIGTFFNLALPGAVSGDFVKAFYLSNLLKIEKSRIFGTILLDRLAGLSALVFVSAGALIFGFKDYTNTPLWSGIQWIIEIGAVSVLVFYAYLFCIKDHRDPFFESLQHLTEKTLLSSNPGFKKLLSPITRIYESIRHYRHYRMTLLKVVLSSIVIHLLVGWCCFNFAQSLGETKLPLLSVYIVVPLGLLITAIPIAPAGIGTGNIAFFYLFQLIGAKRGADIYNLYAFCNLFIGLFGGLAYARLSLQSHKPFKIHEKFL